MRPVRQIGTVVLLSLCLAGALSVWRTAQTRAQTGFSPNIVVQQVVCTTTSLACVWTYHNDNTRGGVNPNETTLTPTKVMGGLSVLKSVITDGLIYAQPLYISQVTIATSQCSQAARNMVFVATENDTVYAFDDTTSTTPCWSTPLLPSGETPVSYTSLPQVAQNGGFVACNNLVAQAGITSTPVIDINVNPPIMYVLAKTVDGGGTAHERLHAVRLRDGVDLINWDVKTKLGGTSAFNPAVLNQRSGLALYHSGNTSTIYMSWGSFCDSNTLNGQVSANPYDGWVAEFQITYPTGASVPSVLSANAFKVEATPSNTNKGGVWMGGAAPAIDNTNGTVFFPAGNGTFDGSTGWGESVIQLSAGSPSLIDWYTPNDYVQLNSRGLVCNQASCTSITQDVNLPPDMDLGAGGVVLLSTQSLSLTNPELVAAGKQGMIYVTWYNPASPGTGLNNTMGGVDGTSCGYTNPTCTESPTSTDCTTGTAPAAGTIAQCWEGYHFAQNTDNIGSRGSPAFIDGGSGNNYLYIAGVQDTLKAFQFTAPSGVGTFSTTAVTPPSPAHTFGYPGASPSISWDGSTLSNAVVWVLDTTGYGTITYDTNNNPVYHAATKNAALYAYAAQPSSGSLTPLWSDTTSGPGSVKFAVPTIAGGMVFVAGGNNNPFYTPGTTNGSTVCTASSPSNCGMLVIWH